MKKLMPEFEIRCQLEYSLVICTDLIFAVLTYAVLIFAVLIRAIFVYAIPDELRISVS